MLTTSQLARTRGQLDEPAPKSTILKRTRGRQSTFDPERLAEVKALCWHGATDPEIADFLGIDPATLTRWKHQFPDLCAALTISKEHADERVKRTLYHKAVGYTIKQQEAIKIKVGEDLEQVEIVEVEKHVPADTVAIKFWLANRDRANWRDQKDVEVSGQIATTPTVDRDLALAVLNMLKEAIDAPMVIEGEVTDVE